METMTQAGHPAPPAATEQPLPNGAERVARLMAGWSMEATQPRPAEISGLRAHLAPGTRVYLSALPDAPQPRLLENVRLVQEAGFEPVQHVAVRNFPTRETLREFLFGLREGALRRRVVVIAGDRERPRGPFGSSLDVIQSGLLQEAGIQGVDISGYPEGHPRIHADVLGEALRAKVRAARAGGLDVNVVTQFCFDAKALLSWLLKLRWEFPDLPVRIGLAGPAEARTLFRFALRCGVKASARGLGRGLVLLSHLSGEQTPERLVTTIAESWAGDEGQALTCHFYAFGGAVRTAAWGNAIAHGNSAPE